MKKSDLKKALKPLIKECIKESLYEEGLLKNIVSQVVEGYSQGATPIVEKTEPTQTPEEKFIKNVDRGPSQSKKLAETKKNLLNALGDSSFGGVNIFEGTTPMKAEGQQHEATLSGMPQDTKNAGVDITSIVNKHWGKLI